ncbi:hypothetical protein OAP69_07025 [Hellea sp.]|nr:hypothetical protein [Hellea sp.]
MFSTSVSAKNVEKLLERNGLCYEPYTTKPYTGTFKEYYPESPYSNQRSLKEIRTYKNGKLDGLHMRYMNQKLFSKSFYKNGILNGSQEYYWISNGQLMSLNNWRNGRLHGPSEDYYKSGLLQAQSIHNAKKNNKNDVTSYHFDENGQQTLKMIIINNELIECDGEVCSEVF